MKLGCQIKSLLRCTDVWTQLTIPLTPSDAPTDDRTMQGKKITTVGVVDLRD